MDIDDDDPVVAEVPIFLNHDLGENLFVYQYPATPSVAESNFNVIKSQIKPNIGEVMMEIGLDTESPNYDKLHGEQIALNVDKDKPASARIYPTKLMDKINYESKGLPVDGSNYATGFMDKDKLVLSPISGVISLLPSLSHMSNPDPEPVEENKGKEEARLVHVKFAKVEAEKYKEMREASYSYFREKANNEPWFSTQYFDSNSRLAQLERSRLSNNLTSTTALKFTSANYLENLVPKMVESSQEIPDHLTSISCLNKLTEQGQVRRILDRVQVVSAIQLSGQLGIDLDKIVQCLQKYAVLVMGNWVLRSDLLYKGSHNRIPQEVMVNSRDYILHEFHQGKTLQRKSLGSIIPLPFDELKEIMSPVGSLKRNQLWEFKLKPDNDFIKQYPDVIEQQNLLWKNRMRNLEEHYVFGPGHAPSQSRKRNNSKSSASSKTQPSPTINSSVSSGNLSTPIAVKRRK